MKISPAETLKVQILSLRENLSTLESQYLKMEAEEFSKKSLNKLKKKFVDTYWHDQSSSLEGDSGRYYHVKDLYIESDDRVLGVYVTVDMVHIGWTGELNVSKDQQLYMTHSSPYTDFGFNEMRTLGKKITKVKFDKFVNETLKKFDLKAVK